LNDRNIIKKLRNSSRELRINCEGFLYDLKLPQVRLDSNSEKNDGKVSMLKIFLNGTLLALIIAVPAIISTVLFHYVIKTNLIITITVGIITLFVAMGFAYKVSKRLAL
jgi:hypothetical protein